MGVHLPDAKAQNRDRQAPSGDTALGGAARPASNDRGKIDPLRVVVWGAFITLVVVMWVAIAVGLAVLV
jgi:hypothetical protein